MLPSTLINTYSQYKQDTNSVATWLASTAKANGYSSDLLSSTSSGNGNKAGGGGRLKGKARANAKKAKAPPKTNNGGGGPNYIIKITDFIALAEFVAGKSPEVPVSFRSTIDRVIAARSAFGAQLSRHGHVDEEKDKNHQYFVGVLEKVRDVLRPFVRSRHEDDAAADEITNRFSGLAIYEPSEEFLNAPDVERPAKAEKDNATYEAETDSSFEEAIFALTALINDLNRVRAHVRWIWSNFRDGYFDLAAAAITTNTVIDLVRNMVTDVMPLLAPHGGIGRMLQQFHLMQCLIKGWKKEDVYKEPTPDNFNDNVNYETYDIMEGTFLVPYRMVEAFLVVVQPGQIPLYKDGMFGHYDPKVNRSKLTGQQKFEQDRALLMPYFAELVTVIRGVADWPVKDEFLRGIEDVIKTKEITFGVVFAAQTFLDITYELGEGIDHPFQTLAKQTTVISNDIKAHFQFHASLKISNWPAQNDQWLKQLQQQVDWIGKDPPRQVQARMYQKFGMLPPDTECHRVFRMSPVMSGLVLYNFRQRYHEVGLTVADAWGSIQYCQHLYNALRKEKLVKGDWADMNVVYTILGKESFFIGGEAPATVADYFKKFCLQMGTSAAAMTGKRRKNTPLASNAGPRGLKSVAPVLSMFKARYVENTGQVDLTPEHVDQIIDMSLFEEEPGQEGLFAQIEDPAKRKEKQEQKPRRKKAVEGGKMTTEQLIKPLMMALHAETLEFAFPYLHFHRWCWRLLRAVKETADGLLRQLYTPNYLERENQLPWVVGWIFMAASGLEGGGVSDRRPLQLAAEALNAMMDTGAGSFLIDKVMGDELGIPVAFEEADE
ncbi:uncharacterized protein PG986_003931 [Apiospora aurea]|uniref:DUF6604 domain-containing protein n=1 Tax=Apiospora aurea TaxID=335848 RepID=A0ABR1QL49_9PEZI